MRKYIYTIFLLLIISSSRSQTLLDTAPDFSGKDIHGFMHYLYPLLDDNKFVLLDFFTTTCGPCVTYAPEIQQAYVHFGSNQGNVYFIGVNSFDNNAGVTYFDSVHGIEFPTISGLDGHGNTIALVTFEVQSFPTMVLIAPNRLILNNQIYPPSFQNLDSTITSSMGLFTGLTTAGETHHGIRFSEMFPVPATDHISILIDSHDRFNLKYELVSAYGQTVSQQPHLSVNPSSQQLNFDVSTLKPGIYFAKFTLGNEIIAFKKIIIK